MEVNKEKIKTGVLAAIGGAILTMIIGFAWGGWVTGGTAQSTAEKMAEDAVANRLAPICVAQFNQDSEKTQKLKKLEETGTWQRGNYVEEQGWATMLGGRSPTVRWPRRAPNCLCRSTSRHILSPLQRTGVYWSAFLWHLSVRKFPPVSLLNQWIKPLEFPI
jgi:hypothetical protein